jgi:hypothetical protein
MRVWGLFAIGCSLMLGASRNDGHEQWHPLAECMIAGIRAGGSCSSDSFKDEGCQRCEPRGSDYVKCDSDTTYSTACGGFTEFSHCDDIFFIHSCNGLAKVYNDNVCLGDPTEMTEFCIGQAERVSVMPTDPIDCTGY